jgi:sortase A
VRAPVGPAQLTIMRIHARIWAGRGLLLVGTGLFAWSAGTLLDAHRSQASLGQRLDALGPSGPGGGALEVARVTRRVAREHGLVGRITIPSVGISAMVLEGTDGRTLRRGVGHVEWTAYPGEPGNVGLAGHRDTWFRALRDVSIGDRIQLRTPDGSFAYRVDTVLIVAPDRGDLLDDGGAGALTLVTCYPFHWVGPAPRRFVVRAHAVRPAVAALAGG